MSDRLHIIITDNEQKPRNFMLSKRKLQLSIAGSLILFLLLGIGSFQAARFFKTNTSLSKQLSGLNRRLEENIALKKQLAASVIELQQLNSSQAHAFAEEKAHLLDSAVSELAARSQMIEQVMCNIGVDVEKDKEGTANSGGPFIAPLDTIGKELLFRSDHYLETINFLPLGRPIPGRITSKFGHRKDPVNGKKGFHTGVDMRGKRGQKILATADGVVSKAFRNGGYGRFVEITHGNGYTTSFAHMQKILVKKGDKVKRGQAVGTVGNSGRSTGPHLHYEICLWKKPVNPEKFMQVDKLTQVPVIPLIATQSKKKLKKINIAQLKTETTLEANRVSL